VLALPVVAELWHRSAFRPGRASLARLAIAAVLVVGSVAVYIDDFSLPSDLRTLLGETAFPDRVPRLSGVIAEGETILSEDPSIPVLRGERPIVLDPYMLIAVGDQHPEWRNELVARIGRAEFDTVVLLFEPGTAREWYRNLHLGSEVAAAIEARYGPPTHAGGYWVYRPR